MSTSRGYNTSMSDNYYNEENGYYYDEYDADGNPPEDIYHDEEDEDEEYEPLDPGLDPREDFGYFGGMGLWD